MEERQLLTLFRQLESYVPNRDELGSIIGYSLAASLFDFNTTSRAREEIQFGQVRAIYQKLEDTLEASRKMPHEEDQRGFQALCDLQIVLEDKLKPDYLRSFAGSGDLAKRLVSYLQQRDRGYEERLRRIGLLLLMDVERRGTLTGKRSILLGDYEAISRQFR